MLQPAELSLAEMGELAQFCPATDPEVKLTYRAIPISGRAHGGRSSQSANRLWAATK
jgi:hypothetical protein